ncbi:GntR family transcriptional regulator [Actinomycetospora corticicola]|uniref:DNA-binding GntR family transcriptional regulator n=1 Tax=Actinomycetospora corticicola TaxID=663602 RepID=A0A7Y9DRR6_9PSEU|nr:GntR family transcriptional regulator [Actinomycetospora corticicola]NYD34295.1 DNA-binding GntR family transcriptional regulator [Actinomycetospora corticicola]
MAELPQKPSRTEQVFEAIVDDICTGRLAPGVPLRQEQLAERFNVSRQPIQQALLLLRNQGLVREFGRRGLEVTPLERSFVSHLYELRGILDGQAARLAAARHTDDWLRHATRIVVAGRQAFDDRAFALMVRNDVEFHRTVVEATANPLLAESAGVMWRNVQRVMGEVLLQGGGPAWVWEDHAAILDAIRDRDGDAAEALARRHAEHGEQLILASMPADTGDAPTSDGTIGPAPDDSTPLAE